MPMTLLKSVLFGALAATFGLVASVAGSLVLGLLAFQGIAATGAGGLGAVSVGIPDWGGLFISIACFALASIWMYRRLQRRAAN
jgi:hypothetical protein